MRVKRKKSMNTKINLDDSVFREPKDIAKILSKERSDKGISQQEVANALDCAKGTIWNIDNIGCNAQTNNQKKLPCKPNPDIAFRYAIYIGLDPFKTVFAPSFYELYLFDKSIDKQIQDKTSALTTQQKLHLLNALSSLVQMVQDK